METTAIYSEAGAVTDWDGHIEVSPVKDDGEFAEVCEPEDATYWSVYLHQKSGGVQCVADFPDEVVARNFAELLKQIWSLTLTRK